MAVDFAKTTKSYAPALFGYRLRIFTQSKSQKEELQMKKVLTIVVAAIMVLGAVAAFIVRPRIRRNAA